VPWPFELIGGALRSVLGVSERAEVEVVRVTPLRETQQLEAKLDETVAAMQRACESLERHADSIGALSDSLPALTESVTRLTEELSGVMRMTAPLAAAERDVSRFDRLLRRRPPAPAAPAPGPAPPIAAASEAPSPDSARPADS
jgi:hypothetical protein